MQGIRWAFIIFAIGIIGSSLYGCAKESTLKETQVIPSPMIEKEQPAPVVPAPDESKTAKNLIPEPPTIPENNVAPPPVCKEKQISRECYNLRPAFKKPNGKSCGRCEPQSLTYARCRSGIMSCRTGRENNPITWLACETKNHNFSNEPLPGSVLILGIDRRHGMPTGHVVYVEEVEPRGPSSCLLVLSHTNYDRKCSLETRIEAIYHQDSKTLDIITGAWKSWGRQLKVDGFIPG